MAVRASADGSRLSLIDIGATASLATSSADVSDCAGGARIPTRVISSSHIPVFRCEEFLTRLKSFDSWGLGFLLLHGLNNFGQTRQQGALRVFLRLWISPSPPSGEELPEVESAKLLATIRSCWLHFTLFINTVGMRTRVFRSE